jgi:comEA protein
MLNRLRKFGFTKQDLTIISFLLITLIAGLILKFTDWDSAPVYDYSSDDKNFEQQVNRAFSSLDSIPLNNEQKERLLNLKKYSDSLYNSKENSEKENLPKNKQGLNPGKKININLATSGDLQALPGIGQVMAERIIEYREQKHFNNIADLKNVKGIGAKKFKKLEDYITVE